MKIYDDMQNNIFIIENVRCINVVKIAPPRPDAPKRVLFFSHTTPLKIQIKYFLYNNRCVFCSQVQKCKMIIIGYGV